ncbi:MAG TPA: hypothetical protein VNK52_16225 [Hyphomicrobiaceae bacterium]|nr:hypothetical protein [Hyphomicrobiaceae bacterium]
MDDVFLIEQERDPGYAQWALEQAITAYVERVRARAAQLAGLNEMLNPYGYLVVDMPYDWRRRR